MDIDAFWKLIDAGRAKSADADGLAEWLMSTLVAMPRDEIASFERRFEERYAEACTWDLWGVAYLANGGCSDDGFDYFRGWLIAQGRKRFDAALADAESIVDYAVPEACACEAMLYVAGDAFEQRTGNRLSDARTPATAQPAGERWNEHDLERRFPKAARKFLG